MKKIKVNNNRHKVFNISNDFFTAIGSNLAKVFKCATQTYQNVSFENYFN